MSAFHTPQIAARLTPGGRGAVAVVAVRGDCGPIDSPSPLFQAANGRPLASQPVGRVVFGRWGRNATEEVVVCRTDEATLEICCHGGEAAVRRLLDDLHRVGWRIVPAAEFLAASLSAFDSDADLALTHATTERAATVLLAQRDVLRAALERLVRDPTNLAERIAGFLSRAEFGRHLTEPWNLVLAGRPNVGKSSLVNALVGFTRSIVSDEPGTTRDVVTAETAYDGWPLRFSDTAGIRGDAGPLEAEGIRRTRAGIEQADLVLLLIDASVPPTPEDEQLLRECTPLSRDLHRLPRDSLIIAHKSDLPDVWCERLPTGALRVSSRTGEGVEALLHRIVSQLVPVVPTNDVPVPFTDRQVRCLTAARQSAIRGDIHEARRALAECLGEPSESIPAD